MDWQNRTERLIGIDNIEKLKRTSVCVLGLGGVGSAVAEALCRSGIGKLIILDADSVDVTNINRQLIATHSVVGKSKCEVAKQRLLDINPSCEIVTITEFLNGKNSDLVFEQKPDYIVDAIDTVTAKLDIIEKAKEYNIEVISSMGTGNKMDPTKLKIVDVRKTSYDPIAKIIRTMVKKERLKGKIMVVCSDEKIIQSNNPEISITLDEAHTWKNTRIGTSPDPSLANQRITNIHN